MMLRDRFRKMRSGGSMQVTVIKAVAAAIVHGKGSSTERQL